MENKRIISFFNNKNTLLIHSNDNIDYYFTNLLQYTCSINNKIIQKTDNAPQLIAYLIDIFEVFPDIIVCNSHFETHQITHNKNRHKIFKILDDNNITDQTDYYILLKCFKNYSESELEFLEAPDVSSNIIQKFKIEIQSKNQINLDINLDPVIDIDYSIKMKLKKFVIYGYPEKVTIFEIYDKIKDYLRNFTITEYSNICNQINNANNTGECSICGGYFQKTNEDSRLTKNNICSICWLLLRIADIHNIIKINLVDYN